MSAKRGNEETKRLDIGARSDALACRVALHLPRPDPDAARRRALLVKMGKGTAALAVLAPLSAHASGTHKLANTSLPGGFGYCTVSGYQSAAVSGAPATACSAYAPSHFLTVLPTLTYSSDVSGTDKAKKLAKYLNDTFFAKVDVISETDVNGTLLANPVATLFVTGKNLVIRPIDPSSGTALRGNNFPDANLDPTGKFNSIFSPLVKSSDGRTLLEVLYDGVLSSSPATAKCYFLSAYLTVYNATPSNLPLGFDQAYVTGQYTDGNAASGTDAYQFFRALCSAP